VKTFSKQLVEKCKEYFHRVHNTDISDDTANEYLRSFAKLYLAFARPNGESLAGGITPRRDDAVAEPSNTGATDFPLIVDSRIRNAVINDVVQLDSMHK
jgi:hypothetical protein